MDTATELRKILVADPDVFAMVGNRIYPQLLPKGTSYADDTQDLPAMHYQLLSDPVKWNVPLSNEQFQFTLVARNYDELRELSRVFKKCVHKYKGGIFQFISYVGGVELWDNDERIPYNATTIQCKVFDMERE